MTLDDLDLDLQGHPVMRIELSLQNPETLGKYRLLTLGDLDLESQGHRVRSLGLALQNPEV